MTKLTMTTTTPKNATATKAEAEAPERAPSPGELALCKALNAAIALNLDPKAAPAAEALQ